MMASFRAFKGRFLFSAELGICLVESERSEWVVRLEWSSGWLKP